MVRLLSTAPALLDLTDLPDRQFAPVGILSPLGSPPAAGGRGRRSSPVPSAAGVAFVLGWRWRLTGPLFAVLFFLLSTYRVSWGHVSHADHLPALQLLLCGLVPAADAWSLDARRRRVPPPAPSGRYGWPIKVLGLLTVVTYVLAGLAKLRYGGFGWLDGDVLRNQIAADALQKSLLGATYSPLVGWVTSHGWVLVPAAVVAVVVELAAPVAFVHGRWRDVWVASAWLLHVAIAAVMAITFPYPLCGVAFAPFYDLERGGGGDRPRVAADRLAGGGVFDGRRSGRDTPAPGRRTPRDAAAAGCDPVGPQLPPRPSLPAAGAGRCRCARPTGRRWPPPSLPGPPGAVASVVVVHGFSNSSRTPEVQRLAVSLSAVDARRRPRPPGPRPLGRAIHPRAARARRRGRRRGRRRRARTRASRSSPWASAWAGRRRWWRRGGARLWPASWRCRRRRGPT